eukprot:gene18321-2152_t
MAAGGAQLTASPNESRIGLRLPVPAAALRPWPCPMAPRHLDTDTGEWGDAHPVAPPEGAAFTIRTADREAWCAAEGGA